MKSVLTIRRAGVIATALATLALLASSGTAGAATWGVAYPPFQTLSNVPFAPLQAVAPISATNVWAVGRDDGSMLAGNWMDVADLAGARSPGRAPTTPTPRSRLCGI